MGGGMKYDHEPPESRTSQFVWTVIFIVMSIGMFAAMFNQVAVMFSTIWRCLA